MFKLGVMMLGRIHGQAPQYLSLRALSVSLWHHVTSRQRLWSASRRLLVIPQYTGRVCLSDELSVWLVRRSETRWL